MKYLLQWEKDKIYFDDHYEEMFKRFNLTGGVNFYIYKYEGSWWSCLQRLPKYNSFKDAMDGTDKVLIEEGWVLVPEGKEDAYKVLV